MLPLAILAGFLLSSREIVLYGRLQNSIFGLFLYNETFLYTVFGVFTLGKAIEIDNTNDAFDCAEKKHYKGSPVIRLLAWAQFYALLNNVRLKNVFLQGLTAPSFAEAEAKCYFRFTYLHDRTLLSNDLGKVVIFVNAAYRCVINPEGLESGFLGKTFLVRPPGTWRRCMSSSLQCGTWTHDGSLQQQHRSTFFLPSENWKKQIPKQLRLCMYSLTFSKSSTSMLEKCRTCLRPTRNPGIINYCPH